MALPSSGPISLKQVRDELKLSDSISLGQQEVRNLANIQSGRISMSDLRGKSLAFQTRHTMTVGYTRWYSGNYPYDVYGFCNGIRYSDTALYCGKLSPNYLLNNNVYELNEFEATNSLSATTEPYKYTFDIKMKNSTNVPASDYKFIKIIFNLDKAYEFTVEFGVPHLFPVSISGEQAKSIFNLLKAYNNKTISIDIIYLK